MPLIDVTEVLTDPDVAGQPFVVVRRRNVVNSYGEPAISEQRFPAYGSIQPAGDNALAREDAHQSQGNSIIVVTTFRLRGAALDADQAEYEPDLVLWQGQHYVVRNLKDWTRFGVGMVEAECTAFEYTPQPPPEVGEDRPPPAPGQ